MNDRDTIILVTGADGFVGTHLCRSLIKKYTVYAFILPQQESHFLEKWGKDSTEHLKIIKDKFENLHTYRKLLQEVHYAVHCAGTMLGAQEHNYIESNLITTRLLLQNLPTDLKKIVFLSSQSAIGPSPSPDYKLKVSDHPTPISFYGQTKLLAEKDILNSPRPAIVFRPASILGPEDKTFLEFFQMADKGRFPILGQKQKQFQFVYVDDLVSAIELVLFSEQKNKIYHIAHPEIGNWERMRSAMERHLNRPLRILFINPTLTRWYLKFFDVREAFTGIKTNRNLNKFGEFMAPNWIFDTSDFEKDTGFKYTHNLNETISSTYSWYQRHSWTRPSLTR
ncbi:MAG: NAD(P)-dependent oxidoreductase [Bdellovibrionaceae bacterium]|nr:NAD(P)-dependent oxidoreductase [Pseudobdellovibrionaceae bacterium]